MPAALASVTDGKGHTRRYTAGVGVTGAKVPRELLDLALQHKGDFEPGKDWKYSNTTSSAPWA
ncbi:hypothetical protein [Streptomyces sp. ET3-23]|uniref:hypothetical protein n=1 Tax=Streptomyces sp. ET3-23 TaxID=2885643 RepID=UPI0035B204EE